MPRRRKATINDLRQAIDCLPRDTRIAMLQGIGSNPIIAGAYSDRDGICPMLAAHRCGGRTSFISFARAWDGFAFRGARVKRARRATQRELLTLRTHLEASLLAEETPAADLTAALAEHRALLERRATERAAAGPRAGAEPGVRRQRPGDPDRTAELRRRGGWRWMRVVRSLDDYERALASLEREAQRAAAADPV